MNQLEVRNLQ